MSEIITISSLEFYPHTLKCQVTGDYKLDITRRNKVVKTIDERGAYLTDSGFYYGDHVLTIKVKKLSEKEMYHLDKMIMLFPSLLLSCKYGLFEVILTYKDDNYTTLTASLIQKL